MATQVQAVPGCGIVGSINGQGYAMGSMRWAQALQAEIPADAQAFLQQWSQQGATLSVLMAVAGDLPQAQGGAELAATQIQAQTQTHARIVAAFAFTDTIKPESAAAVAQLHALGLQTVLISGDNRAAAEALARQLGMHPERGEVLAEVLPQGKAQAIAQLQGAKQGAEHGNARVVCMVGDGINDAPALAAADVGMAMGNGTDVAMHAAGITLMRGDPMLVAAALDISRRTVAKIRQNLFWAFFYNVAGIPLAALGYLNPVVAGAAMALSSVSVMANALLLKRWRM